ncbi:MAG: hypothetical protein WC220_04385 [Pedobacter sp.]|jgi:hypothetical protein
MVFLTGLIPEKKIADLSVYGAWKTQQSTLEQVLLFSDGYFMHTIFDRVNKQFIQTRGGTYTVSGKDVIAKIEFNTHEKDQIGQSLTYSFAINKDRLNTNISGKKATWELLDKGEGDMAGTWRMSGRKQEDKIVLSPRGARKTLKILTGTKFQWAAINTETKEFFGTGGGSYTFVNGKYTENIEFFSRDNKRVGASLSFDGKLVDGMWHHSGLSSTGNPIYEVWSRER